MDIGEIGPSRLLRRFAVFSSLERFGSVKNVARRSIFIESGDIPQYCYLVKKGCIIGFEYTSGGDERVYDIMLPGSLMLEANLLLNEPSPVFFKAVKPSILVCIDRHTLLKQMNADFNLSIGIVSYISAKFLSAMEQVRGIVCHDTIWRLCNLLLMFAEYFGAQYEDKKVLIKEKLSQQILADMLGVNRITVNRIVKELKNMDLIIQINNYYCIPNIERLKKHMSYLED